MPGAQGGTGFDDLNFSSKLHKILLPGGRTGRLYLIDPKTGVTSFIGGFSVDKNYLGGHTQSITSACEGGGFIFTTDRDTLRLHALDPQTNAIVASAPLSALPDFVRFMDAANEVWVTQPGITGRIEIFKFSAHPKPVLSRSGFIDVPGGPEFLSVDRARQIAYTNLYAGMTVGIDVRTRAILKRWANGCQSSRGIALDDKRGFLFVGCMEGKAVALDLKRDGLRVSSLLVPPGVDVIGYNPELSHLYVSSNVLSVIGVSGQGKLSLLGMGQAEEGAACTTGDDQGHIWVCNPQQGQLLLFKDSFKG